jgi:FixJ family two-component response regulator
MSWTIHKWDDRFRRRKEIYDRFQAGETAKQIADDLGISVQRVHELKRNWQDYLRKSAPPRSPEYGYA